MEGARGGGEKRKTELMNEKLRLFLLILVVFDHASIVTTPTGNVVAQSKTLGPN